jgi:phosphinothricin acetyltransferase
MEIRIAKREDLPAINNIYNQAVRQRYSTAHLEPVGMKEREQWFDAHDPAVYPVYIATSHQKVAGWVSLGPYREKRQALAHVAEVSYYVDKMEQGKGVGSKLLDHAIRVAPDFGYSVLIAILLNRNPASRALLGKFGFEEWGRMPEIARIDGALADHLYYGLKL